MKEPKTFKRPRLYYQAGWDSMSPLLGNRHWDRIRIIYPDGTSEYLGCENCETGFYGRYRGKRPCWSGDWMTTDDGRVVGKDKSGKIALERMRDYDMLIPRWGYAEFLGEL